MKVLLIGWDAADWKIATPLMEAGLMPNLTRFVEGGVMGQIATLKPALSPMLWTSIATGKRPFKHGIHGFAEPTADGLAVRPVTNLSRRVRAIWNILQLEGYRSSVVGWWPSNPAEPISGVMVSDHFQAANAPSADGWPLPHGSVHPPRLEEPLAGLRFHPDEVTVDMIEPFIPRVREIDQDTDRRLAALMRTFAHAVSIHAASTWLMEHEPWDFMAVYHDAIDHACHSFIRYHPPRLDFVAEHDYELYQGVVDGIYRFHDMMLGSLLTLAGDETTVILMSDHGFHPDQLRLKHVPEIPAGPALEHRDFGIFAMRGPAIRKDELIHGASLLDITPTLLTLFGLPVADDMDGKVLLGAFEEAPAVRTIPSWENVAGADGRHPPDRQLDPIASQEALQQLVELGYIERPGDDARQAVADTVTELRYNLAESYQDGDRHADALTILRELHAEQPDEQRFAVRRFTSCQALGHLSEMREIVADLDTRRRAVFEAAVARSAELVEAAKARRAEEGTRERLLTDAERAEWSACKRLLRFNPSVVNYLKAQVNVMEGFPGAALDLLDGIKDTHVARPGLLLQTASVYAQLERFADAEATYARALEVDPDNAHAHLGLGRMALRRRDFAPAAEHTLEAIRRLHHYPLAHFTLGLALIGLARYADAAAAMRVAVTLNPNFWQAHRRLALLLHRRLGDPTAAAEHLRLARAIKAGDRPSPIAAPEAQTARVPSTARTVTAPATAERPPADGPFITVVTGLPRSGTSMLMQMLAAGGLPVLTGGEREADEDNPRGYLEFAPVMRLHQDSSWLVDAYGKAAKIVAPLLPYLPPWHSYRVVFIERSLDEVIASQERMLARRGAVSDAPARRARLIADYARTVERTQMSIANRGCPLLRVNHADAIGSPHGVATEINRFLGGGLAVDAMAAAVDASLHRQRRA